MREYPPEWDEEICEECAEWADECECGVGEPDWEQIAADRDAEAARQRQLDYDSPGWDPR